MKKTVPVLIWLLLALPCQSRIITVDDDGAADFTNIQAAIDDADHGDVIEVQPGTYTGYGNRDIDYNGKAITVRSIDSNDPNIVAKTIVHCGGSEHHPPTGYHIGFYFVNNEDTNSVLDGLTITNGYAERGGGIYCENSKPTIMNCIISNNKALDYGGGLCCCLPILPPPPPGEPIPECNFPGPTISNCTFTGNSADFGGGIYTETNGTTITNSIITGNTVQYAGGGIYFVLQIFEPPPGGPPPEHNIPGPILTNCTLSKNFAGYGGGGIYNLYSNLTITDCIFYDNLADFGGGMSNNTSYSSLTKCVFKGNTANSGGGIYNSESNASLINCNFNKNSSSTVGGGLHNRYSSPILTNCSFSGNTADWGGGISNYKANPTITNCIFSGNAAIEGAGVHNYESSPNVTNCIFSGNSSVGAGWYKGYGGGMFNLYSRAQLMNCTFTGNRAGARGGAIAWIYLAPPQNLFEGDVIDSSIIASSIMINNLEYTGDTNAMITNCIFWNNKDCGDTEELSQIYVTPTQTTIIINYNCVQGWTGTLDGIGNIGADPCFVGNGYWDPNTIPNQDEPYWLRSLWVDGDYHLLPESPCIDAGDPNYVAEPNETDLDGKPRVINSRIDMGAYEYSPPIPAKVRFVPNTINLKSKGKWIVALLRLPEEYDVVDIDPNSILLENEIKPDRFWLTETKQTAITRFDREQVQNILDIGEVELTIRGRLTDDTIFEAKDTIKVIDKSGGKPVKQHQSAK